MKAEEKINTFVIENKSSIILNRANNNKISSFQPKIKKSELFKIHFSINIKF